MIVIQSFSKGGNYEIAKISLVFSQVSDVAHGPLETFNFMYDTTVLVKYTRE